MKQYSNVEEYISAYQENVQELLNTIRKTIKKVAPPETGEKIAYGIPTFTYYGNLVHYGGFKDHVSLFPGAAPVEVFKEKLKGYETSKGTIQFPLDKPLPLNLIQDIVKLCVERNLQKIKK